MITTVQLVRWHIQMSAHRCANCRIRAIHWHDIISNSDRQSKKNNIIESIRIAEPEMTHWATSMCRAMFSTVPNVRAMRIQPRIATANANIEMLEKHSTALTHSPYALRKCVSVNFSFAACQTKLFWSISISFREKKSKQIPCEYFHLAHFPIEFPRTEFSIRRSNKLTFHWIRKKAYAGGRP